MTAAIEHALEILKTHALMLRSPQIIKKYFCEPS
jgi:hypothetical protein